MIGRSGLWRTAVVLFTLINVVALIYAAGRGETMHAVTHASLLAAGFVFWQVRRIWRRDPVESARPQQIDSHLDHLQQSVDAIAIEVERIGEGQRFAQKVLEEKLGTREKNALGA
jgi:hypothetical protein